MSANICINKQWFAENITDVEQLDNLSDAAYEARLNGGRRHMPVRHSELLTKFRDKAESLGLQLANEQGRLKKDGERFMYTANIVDASNPTNDFALSLGFLSHNDMTKSFQGLLGSHVFMCCNGVCHGVIQPSRIRHTIGNVKSGRVFEKVDVVFDRFLAERGDVQSQIAMMKGTKLTDAKLGEFLLKITRAHRMGNKNILEIVNYCDDPAKMIADEVENPTLNSKDDNSMFRLMNACSYVTSHRIKNPAAQQSTSKFLNDTIMGLISPGFKPVGDIVDVEEVDAED